MNEAEVSVKEQIRNVANAAFAEGIDTHTFMKMAKQISEEESEKRTRATAASIYGNQTRRKEP